MRRRRGSIATAIAATTVVGTVAVALPAAPALMGVGCCIVRGSLAISRVGAPAPSSTSAAQQPPENQDEQPEDDGEEQDICDQ